MDKRIKEGGLKETDSSKFAKRMLKFNERKGAFQFPRRERFNEEHEQEIEYQKED